MDDDQQQTDVDLGFVTIDDTEESLFHLKQEDDSSSSCCQYGSFGLTSDKPCDTDEEAVPQSSSSDVKLEELVGMGCGAYESSLDDVLAFRDFPKDFKELDLESGILGCEMWEETFTEVLFPSLLAV